MRDITIVMDQSESRRLCILRYLSHLPNGPFTMLRFASSSCRQNTYADYHKNQSKRRERTHNVHAGSSPFDNLLAVGPSILRRHQDFGEEKLVSCPFGSLQYPI